MKPELLTFIRCSFIIQSILILLKQNRVGILSVDFQIIYKEMLFTYLSFLFNYSRQKLSTNDILPFLNHSRNLGIY